jgi:hypothetical protein
VCGANKRISKNKSMARTCGGGPELAKPNKKAAFLSLALGNMGVFACIYMKATPITDRKAARNIFRLLYFFKKG